MSKLWICERKRITIGKEMNEYECLQQVIDILADNAHEMCAVEGDSNDIILDANMDGVQTIAKEICNVFAYAPKDTRSRRERQLDVDFERMGVKPRVYLFTDLPVFKAITIATIAKEDSYAKAHTYILMNYTLDIAPATSLLKKLKDIGIYGIAICDKSDQFNKRRGRMKAKGRLMQHLLQEAKKE